MSQFIIHGREKLSGEVEIFGAKNEATKIVAAAVLTNEDVVINNAPRILDLEKMMAIVRSMAGKAEWTGAHQATINCSNLDPEKIDYKLVKKLRASVVLIGPLLARFKQLKFPTPGGCIIGNRSLETHFNGFQTLGVVIKEDYHNDFYEFDTTGLKANKIVLEEFSVTATENLLMAASLTKGKTIIKIAACEPHVENLINCLIK